MEECCDNVGGRVILTIDNVRYQSRGGITIQPTTFTKDVGAHDDGTIYVTTRAKPARASFALSDRCGLILDTLVKACHVDVTLELIDMKKTFLFTRATVIGDPSINTDSGEISGLSIVSSQVKMILN